MKIIKNYGDIINKYIKLNQWSKVEMSTLLFMDFFFFDNWTAGCCNPLRWISSLAYWFFFFLSSLPVYPFRVFTGRPHRLDVGEFDPNTLPYNPALFLHSPRVRALCTHLLWCGKTSIYTTRENPHQEQRTEESNLSMLQKTTSGYSPPPAGLHY